MLPSLFFQEIVHSNLSVLLSILLAIVLGSLLGLVEVLIFNKMSDTDDKPPLGLLFGGLLGLVFGVFGSGVPDISNSEPVNQSIIYISLIYNGAIGSRIGATIFPIFAMVTTIREMLRPYEPVRKLS